MSETQRAEECAIDAALEANLNWAEARLTVNRREHMIWRALRGLMARNVLAGLHDAGFAIVPVGGHLEPTLTVERVPPYQYKARVQVEVPASYIAWAEVLYDARFSFSGGPRYGEHITRQLIKTMAYHFEDAVIDIVGPVAARTDFTPKRSEDA